MNNKNLTRQILAFTLGLVVTLKASAKDAPLELPNWAKQIPFYVEVWNGCKELRTDSPNLIRRSGVVPLQNESGFVYGLYSYTYLSFKLVINNSEHEIPCFAEKTKLTMNNERNTMTVSLVENENGFIDHPIDYFTNYNFESHVESDNLVRMYEDWFTVDINPTSNIREINDRAEAHKALEDMKKNRIMQSEAYIPFEDITQKQWYRIQIPQGYNPRDERFPFIQVMTSESAACNPKATNRYNHPCYKYNNYDYSTDGQ